MESIKKFIIFLKKIIIYSCKKNISKSAIKNLSCSEFEINSYIISEFISYRLIPIVGLCPYPINELFLMVSAVVRLKPDHIFEWGTNIGKSARIFYETIKYFKINCKIHSIDLPDDIEHQEHPYSKRGILVKNLKEIKLYQGDGLTKSLEILSDIKNFSNPLFFLDGDHEYSSVKKELISIMSEVPSANIIIHDTFYQSKNSNYNIGPYKAIRDTLDNNRNNYKVISINTGLPGMTLLYKLRDK